MHSAVVGRLISHLSVAAAVFDGESGMIKSANKLWSQTPELLAASGTVTSNGGSLLPNVTGIAPEPILGRRLRDKIRSLSDLSPQTMGIAIATSETLSRVRLNLMPMSHAAGNGVGNPVSSVMVWLDTESSDLPTFGLSITEAMHRHGEMIAAPWAYVGADGIYHYLSPQAFALLGPDADSVVGVHYAKWSVDKPGRSVGVEQIRLALQGERQVYDRLRYDYRFLEERWHRVEMTPDVDQHGGIAGVFVASHDIHERRSAEAQALNAQRQLDLHLNVGPLLVIELDADLRIKSWSKQCEALLGFAASEVIGRTPRELNTIPDIDSVESQIVSLLAEGQEHAWRSRNANRTKNGETVWIDWFDSVIGDSGSGDASVLCVGVDVTQELALKQRLTIAATHDALTGLLNRQAFAMLIDSKIKAGTQFALMVLDLDSFKQINDYRGHPAGDRLLIAIAGRLRALLEPAERVARLGGDEFAVLLNVPDNVSAATLRERAAIFLQHISEPINIGSVLSVSASAGLIIPNEEDADSESLMKHVDMAMYRAKAEGRNRVVTYSKLISDEESARFEKSEALRALIRAQGLEVHYQPLFDAVTDEIVGAEALARWTHQGESIDPSWFIALAEASGFIHELWECVMRKACRFSVEINHRAASSCPVSVNVSPLQLTDAQFDVQVVRILRETSCLPQWVGFEVTESVGLGDAMAAATLRKLSAIGLRCSVDDFGTGYSNFAHLKRLPLSTLKIDKVFVRDIGTGECAIVNSIIAMAHSLGLKVVAEGVEFVEELTALKAMGCDFYQGFISSAPIPGDDFAAMLRIERRARVFQSA
jgi:diguanylate cyclase (GGDEF)-like protein/PAS domain S-box-containing protein